MLARSRTETGAGPGGREKWRNFSKAIVPVRAGQLTDQTHGPNRYVGRKRTAKMQRVYACIGTLCPNVHVGAGAIHSRDSYRAWGHPAIHALLAGQRLAHA